MSKTKFKKHILNFYNDFLLSTSINDPGSVAWSSKKSQYTRFDKLFEIGVTKNNTILDLGCGLGHMVDYLQNKNFPMENYRGIDINPNYILYAIQRKPGITFSTGEIFDVSDKFDYIIGSGVFTVQMPISEVFAAIEKSFELCNKGVAFNFLNKDFMDNVAEFNTFVPEEFYSLIKNKFSKTKLVTDYLENEDFTIYIYK
jgi:cyclopropane fatty-acyl-phospholipid synthase-like methyltransferase